MNPFKTIGVFIATFLFAYSLTFSEVQESGVFFEATENQNFALIEKNTLVPLGETEEKETDDGATLPKHLMSAIVTGYSSTIEETDDTPFITAQGTPTREGIVANNFLPFGTQIKIPEVFGNKIFVVEDRMHWQKSKYYFDVWFPEKELALHFGARMTYIEILD